MYCLMSQAVDPGTLYVLQEGYKENQNCSNYGPTSDTATFVIKISCIVPLRLALTCHCTSSNSFISSIKSIAYFCSPSSKYLYSEFGNFYFIFHLKTQIQQNKD